MARMRKLWDLFRAPSKEELARRRAKLNKELGQLRARARELEKGLKDSALQLGLSRAAVLGEQAVQSELNRVNLLIRKLEQE